MYIVTKLVKQDNHYINKTLHCNAVCRTASASRGFRTSACVFLRRFLLKRKAACEYKNRYKLLSRRRPLRRGVVTKAVLRSPKKPHSSKRATVKFNIQSDKRLKNYAYILGEGGRKKLKKYDVIYFRGGRRRDIPAMKYTAVHGVTTSTGKSSSLLGLHGQRTKSRTKYGAKRPKTMTEEELNLYNKPAGEYEIP